METASVTLREEDDEEFDELSSLRLSDAAGAPLKTNVSGVHSTSLEEFRALYFGSSALSIVLVPFVANPGREKPPNEGRTGVGAMRQGLGCRFANEHVAYKADSVHTAHCRRPGGW